jgi:hypothetical protein
LPAKRLAPYTVAIQPPSFPEMTTFNRFFTTERLLQIIFVLSATVIMKLLS